MTHVYIPSNDSVLKVATVADLPTTAPDGQLAITLDTDTLYAFDGNTSSWVVIGGSGVLNAVTDTNSVDLTVTGTALSADVRLSSDAADAGYTIVPIDIRAGVSKGLRAQVQNSAIQGLISVTDTNSVDLTYAAGAISGDVRLSTNAADAGYTKIALDIQAAVSLGLRAQVQNTTVYGLFSGTAPISFNSTTGAISITQSGVATDGYLSSTDWNTFNNKVSSTRTISTTTPLQGGGDLSANRTLSILQSGAAQDGYLSSTDWNTFNNKVSTTRTISTTAPLSGGGDLSANRTIAISLANTTTDGYLSSTDWNTFNSKQAAITVGTLGAGNANGLSLSAGTLTLHAATATQPGAVSATTQTIAGDKTFSGSVALRDLKLNNTGATFAITLNSPGALGANYTFTLPSDGGTSGYILSTNGSGTTSWVASPSGVQLLSGSAGNLATGTVTFSTSSDAFGFIVEFSTERGAIFCSAGYSGTGITVTSDVGGYFLSSDAGTGVYIFKSATTNVISIKNRLGGTRTIKVTILTDGVATLSAFA